MASLDTGQHEDQANQSQASKQYRDLVSEWESDKERKFVEFAPRMMRIAESNVGDAGARDALFWIVSSGAYGTSQEIKTRAAKLLIDHHANDVELARAALTLRRPPSADCDALLEGLVAESRSHEARGLARMAFAQYLMGKARICTSAQAGTMEPRVVSFYDEAYLSHLRSCDVASLEKSAVDLLEQIVAEQGDVAYVRSGNGGALDRIRKKTLADQAKSKLDEIRNLAIGRPAPLIDGVDLDGKPLRLSDYRGRVVVLVFWASWCGPCMAEVPSERELVESLSDEPFALLGVNCDVDPESARKTVESAQINWVSWHDGIPTPFPRPIVERFHVDSLPTVFVIDAEGAIRAKGLHGKRLEETVRELLGELDARPGKVSSRETRSTK